MQLIAARGAQGVGAALLMPGTLSILTVTFPPQERAKAIGLWAGVSGLALALGPTLGGYMVEHLGWESVFFLNVPIGIVAFIVATRTVRESRSDEARSLDVVGLALGTATLFSLTYALIEASQRGWTDPLIVTGLVGGTLLGVSFLVWEGRNPRAMMPLAFFRIPAFSAGNIVAFSVSLGMFATFFFLSLFMQNPFLRGYTAFETGLRFLPMTLMIVVTAPNAGRYASKHGSRAPMTYGLILAGGGLISLSFISPESLGLSRAQQNSISAAAGHGQLDLDVLGLSAQQAAAVGQAFGDAFMSGFRLALVVAGLALLTAALIANRFIPGREAGFVHVPGELAVAAEV